MLVSSENLLADEMRFEVENLMSLSEARDLCLNKNLLSSLLLHWTLQGFLIFSIVASVGSSSISIQTTRRPEGLSMISINYLRIRHF